MNEGFVSSLSVSILSGVVCWCAVANGTGVVSCLFYLVTIATALLCAYFCSDKKYDWTTRIRTQLHVSNGNIYEMSPVYEEPLDLCRLVCAVLNAFLVRSEPRSHPTLVYSFTLANMAATSVAQVVTDAQEKTKSYLPAIEACVGDASQCIEESHLDRDKVNFETRTVGKVGRVCTVRYACICQHATYICSYRRWLPDAVWQVLLDTSVFLRTLSF